MQDLVKVAVIAIQLIHEEDYGLLQFLRITEGIHRTYLWTILAIDEEDSLISNVQGGNGTTYEVIGSRTVDDVQFLVIPLYMEYGGKDRVAILLLYGEVVTHRVLTLYGATALDDASLIDHCFGKSSLAATRTAKQCDVLDFVCLINLHIN